VSGLTRRRLVDRHFAGTISPEEERALRPHLPGCRDCRAYYQRYLVLARFDPAALAAEERIARGLGLCPKHEREVGSPRSTHRTELS
jgi:hypothetical protein